MDLKKIKIASNIENNRKLNDYTEKLKNKSSFCGDEIEISLKIKNHKIIDFGYQSKSCIYCEAAASMLSHQCKKKSIIKIKSLIKNTENFFENPSIKLPNEWHKFVEIVNKNNLSRKECIMLPFSVLSKLIKNYE